MVLFAVAWASAVLLVLIPSVSIDESLASNKL